MLAPYRIPPTPANKQTGTANGKNSEQDAVANCDRIKKKH
jgi:hypothetical protein